MKYSLLILSSLISATVSFAQNLPVTRIADLDSKVKESSGLLIVNGHLITHNDSGGDPVLYEIDQVNGTIVRTIKISNAKNTDWEDLAQDENYIYIGDIGNNLGTRTDLKVYRISKADFLTRESLTADSIEFNYADQLTFTSAQYKTNYDAEALTVTNDSIFIFTKNWGNKKCYLYGFPKAPGNYSSLRSDSLNVQGLVTAATYDNAKKALTLIGYNPPSQPFIIFLQDYPTTSFFKGSYLKKTLNLSFATQTEGLARTENGDYFISSEGSTTGTLYLISASVVTEEVEKREEVNLKIFPNPASQIITVKGLSGKARILNAQGKILIESMNEQIDISVLPEGIYWIQVSDFSDHTTTFSWIKN